MTIYFLHGLNGHPSQWKPLQEYLSKKGFDSIAYDFMKDQDLRKIRFQDYVDTIASEVSEDTVLIGHSMGGLLVQKIAEATHFKSGICICAAPPKGISLPSPGRFSSLRYVPYVLFNIPFAPMHTMRQQYIQAHIPEKEIPMLLNTLQKQSAKVTYEVMRNKIAVDEKKISCPLFFIATKDDELIPRKVSEATAAYYHAPLEILPGHHHIFSHWKPIAQTIEKYLVNL